MERNKMNVLIKILAVVIICLISFVGIYVQNLNTMENIVKNYKLGDELEGYREAIFEIASDTSDELKTEENYEKVKSIFEDRLKNLNVENYNISLDKKTGKIYLQIPENDDTDTIVTNIKETGKFEIKDSEDGTVLLDNSKIQNVRTAYNTTENGTVVFLEIKFDKEGTAIYKDITGNTYAKVENTTTENTTTESSETSEENDETENNNETEENENSEEENNTTEENNEQSEEVTEKKITLAISGQDITSTNFENVVENGTIDLSMNAATTDSKEISEYAKSATTIATILNNGPLPVEYSVAGNQYLKTDISINSVLYVLAFVGVVIAILLVYMILKYKVSGLLSAISYIGFIALYSLLLRYTNVVITLETIVGIVLIALINYWFNMRLLSVKLDNKKQYDNIYKDFIMKIIPVFAISVIFALIRWSMLNTIGMAIIWGVALILIYNRLVTKNIVE